MNKKTWLYQEKTSILKSSDEEITVHINVLQTKKGDSQQLQVHHIYALNYFHPKAQTFCRASVLFEIELL